jgi:hypothetical protein
MAIRKIVSRSLGDGTVNKQELDVSASGAGTGAAILPSGTTGQRPGSAAEGMLRYNTTTGLYEQYTATGWQAVDAPPTISSISPSTFNGESGTTITLTGTGFKSGSTVKFIANGGTEYTATTTTFVSSNSVTATTPQDFTVADEPFDVKLINASGLAGTLENALDCGGSPTFTTASGTLGTIYDSARSSYSLSTAAATDPDTSATISYAVTSGALPTGLSLNSSTAAITGTAGAVGSDTTSSFTITATDNAGNTTSRAFSIVVKAPIITSFTATGSSTFSVPSGLTAVQVLMVAGGGGAGGRAGGGGGGGGMIEMPSFPVTPGGSVSYTVGGGGIGAPGAAGFGFNGSNSVFGSLTAIGGGGGGDAGDNPDNPAGVGNGRPGGSGGGAGYGNSGGTATQPSQPGNSGTYGYGYPGGAGGAAPDYNCGGGGGAGSAGSNSTPTSRGNGGNGRASSISGSSVTYAGGGGGGDHVPTTPSGGLGGPGGGGNAGASGGDNPGSPGTDNRGGGGGGGSSDGGPGGSGGNGGPGIIIIKY